VAAPVVALDLDLAVAVLVADVAGGVVGAVTGEGGCAGAEHDGAGDHGCGDHATNGHWYGFPPCCVRPLIVDGRS
jgi:hypothetical protein